MRRLGFVLGAIVWCALIGQAQALTYTFDDKVDTWGWLGVDSALILQGHPLTYTHDLTDDVDFGAGDTVTEAFLELDFTNDLTDDYGSKLWGLVRWDFRENAKVGYDGTSWVDVLGEVDDGQYLLTLDVDWLNDDGLLDVTVSVSNPLGTASAWLDHSRVYGVAETAPVPEPGTLLLFGSGLVGLAGVARRRRS